MDNSKWDDRFIKLARHISEWSKDPSTQCAAVITDGKRIVSAGYNGFPANTDDNPLFYECRETKLMRVLHAEINALLFARRDVLGCTCYVWPIPPCSQCAAALVQAGIKRVVSVEPSDEQRERWAKSFDNALCLLREAHVDVTLLHRESYFKEEE